jgi:hypothetical protein
MTWTRTAVIEYSRDDSRRAVIEIPGELNQPLILLEFEFSGYEINLPGELIQFIDIESIGRAVISRTQVIDSLQLIRLSAFQPYRLLFVPINQLPDTYTLSVWSNDDMNLFNPATVTVPARTATSNTAPATVAASTTSVSVLAANSNRKGGTIWNNTTGTALIAFHTAASTSAYSLQLVAGGYLNLDPNYIGPISAIWAASQTGNLLVSEFV